MPAGVVSLPAGASADAGVSVVGALGAATMLEPSTGAPAVNGSGAAPASPPPQPATHSAAITAGHTTLVCCMRRVTYQGAPRPMIRTRRFSDDSTQPAQLLRV